MHLFDHGNVCKRVAVSQILILPTHQPGCPDRLAEQARELDPDLAGQIGVAGHHLKRVVHQPDRSQRRRRLAIDPVTAG